MARGQRQAADQQRALTNQYAADAYQRAENLYGMVGPEYQKQLTSGYSPAEQAAITNATMGGLGATFDRLRQSAENRVARTRNAAGFNELEDELARSQGREAARLAAQDQFQFANEAQRRKEFGLRGLSGLYGVNEEEMARLLGLGPGLLQARAAGRGGFGIGFGPGGLSFGFGG